VKLKWADEAWEDYLWWHKHDRRLYERVNKLIEEIRKDPFRGIGKPEPLRHQYAGCWSRRVSLEHRLVYRVTATTVEFLQARYHYR